MQSSAHKDIRKNLKLKAKQNQNSKCVHDAKAPLGLFQSESARALCLNVHTGGEALGPHSI